jgi:hypothetical protein
MEVVHPFSNFAYSGTHLYRTIIKVFEEFTTKSIEDVYNKLKGTYRRFLDLVGGVSGDNLVAYGEGEGAEDLVFASELYKILEQEDLTFKHIKGSWLSFANYLNHLVNISDVPPKVARQVFSCKYCKHEFDHEPTGDCSQCARNYGYKKIFVSSGEIAVGEETTRQKIFKDIFASELEDEKELVKMLKDLRNTI